MTSDETEIVMHTLYAILYLTDGEDSQISEIINMDIVEILLEKLKMDNNDIRIPALKVVANMLSGEQDDIDYLINYGVIAALAPFFRSW